MRLRFVFVVFGSCVLYMAGPQARAQPAAAELGRMLTVEPSGDGCIRERALGRRVARFLKHREHVPALAIVVRAAGDPVSFTLARDGEAIAERTFEVLPERCADRLDAIAIAIAVAVEHAVEPSASSAEAEPNAAPQAEAGADAAPSPSPPPAEPAEPAPASETPSPAAEAEAEQSEGQPDAAGPGPFRLLAGGGVLVETLPSPAFALTAGAEVVHGHLRFALAALATPHREVALGPGSADLRLLGARAHACLTTRAADFGLEGCTGAAAAAVLASGEGFAINEDARMAWVAALLGAALRYPENSTISARLAVDLLAHMVRPELAVGGPAAARAVANPFGLAASLELSVALP